MSRSVIGDIHRRGRGNETPAAPAADLTALAARIACFIRRSTRARSFFMRGTAPLLAISRCCQLTSRQIPGVLFVLRPR